METWGRGPAAAAPGAARATPVNATGGAPAVAAVGAAVAGIGGATKDPDPRENDGAANEKSGAGGGAPLPPNVKAGAENTGAGAGVWPCEEPGIRAAGAANIGVDTDAGAGAGAEAGADIANSGAVVGCGAPNSGAGPGAGAPLNVKAAGASERPANGGGGGAASAAPDLGTVCPGAGNEPAASLAAFMGGSAAGTGAEAPAGGRPAAGAAAGAGAVGRAAAGVSGSGSVGSVSGRLWNPAGIAALNDLPKDALDVTGPGEAPKRNCGKAAGGTAPKEKGCATAPLADPPMPANENCGVPSIPGIEKDEADEAGATFSGADVGGAPEPCCTAAGGAEAAVAAATVGRAGAARELATSENWGKADDAAAGSDPKDNCGSAAEPAKENDGTVDGAGTVDSVEEGAPSALSWATTVSTSTAGVEEEGSAVATAADGASAAGAGAPNARGSTAAAAGSPNVNPVTFGAGTVAAAAAAVAGAGAAAGGGGLGVAARGAAAGAAGTAAGV